MLEGRCRLYVSRKPSRIGPPMPAVSHNVPEAKPIDEGPTRDSLYKNHTLEVRPL